MTHPSWRGAAVCAVLIGLLVAAPRESSAQIVVGKAVQVSASHPIAAHTEYFIDTDPSRGGRLAICSMAIDPSKNRITSILYTSSDTGRSWRAALNDTVSTFGQSMDPACAFGFVGSKSVEKDRTVRSSESLVSSVVDTSGC
jgi:hypothetical protein